MKVAARKLNQFSFTQYFLVLAVLTGSAAEAATGLTYHGRIIKPNNQPLTAASVFFDISIRSPGAENCLLFSETQTLDMSASAGVFVLTIGEGTRAGVGVDGGNSFDKIFANRGTLTLPSCNVGTTYTPNTADGRRLVVQFNDGSGWQALPTQNINYVPLSVEAIQIGGYKKEQLLRVADGVVATEFSNANWTALWDLITGASTVYSRADGSNFNPTADVDFNGQQIIDLADPTSAQDAATKNYVDTSLGGRVLDPVGVSNLAGDGRTLVWDQAQNKWVTGIPNDTSKLPLSGGTMTGAVNMGAFSVTNIGHIVLADQGTMYLGKFSSAQETALLLTPLSNTTDRGRTWFNVDTLKMRYWDGLAAQDVASEDYVDSLVSSSIATASANYLRHDGTVALSADWDVDGAGPGTRKLTGLAIPTDADGAVTKAYADSRLLGLNLSAPGAGEVSKSIRWNAAGTAWEYFTPFTAADLTAGNITTALGYTPQASLGFTPVNRAGDTMTGLLLLSADPSNAVGAATKQYVDAVSSAAAGAYVRIDGTTSLTADWDLNGLTVGGTRLITGVDTPTVADGAANKAYVDAREAAAIATANAYTDASSAAAQAAAIAAAQVYSDGKLVSKDLAIPAAGQDGQSIRWNNTSGDWEYFTASVSTGTVSTVTSANGDATITNNTTTPEITINTGTGNNQIVKLNGSAELPGVSGVNLTALNATNVASGTLPDARLSTNVALKTYVDTAEADAVTAANAYSDSKLVSKDLAVPLAGQDGQSIRYNNTSGDWEYFAPATGSVTNIATGTGLTGGPISGTGTISIAAGGVSATELASDAVTTVKVLDSNVTYAKIQNVTTNKLLGRATGGAGVLEEITLGSGLAFTGTTLNAVGSGGTVTQVTSANADIGVATTTSTPLLTLNTGTGASQIVKLNASAELPSVSGINLTVLNASNIASGTLADARLSANVALKAYTDANILGLPAAAPTGAQVGQAIRWNAGGTAWEYFTPGLGNGSVTSVTSANADLSISTTTTTPVITLNTGSGADQILKLNASAQIPAVDGSLVTNLSAANLTGTINDARLSTNVALKSYVDAGDAAERTYVDGKLVSKNLAVPVMAQDGQSIRWNNTSNAWEYFTAGSGSGTVSSVTSANSDASYANTTTTPVLTINTGTGANQLVKLNGSAELPSVSGINLTALNASNITSGTLPNARLTSSVALAPSAPVVGNNGQALRWNNGGSAWEYFTPGTGNGSVTNIATGTGLTGGPITGTGTISIAAGGVSATELASDAVTTVKVLDANVTYAKIQNVSATNRLLGRATAGAGVMEEITLGTGLSLTGSTLNAAGSGGTVTSVTSANGDASIATTTTTPVITINTGTGVSQIVKLDASARLPAVDASQVTAINASNIGSGTLADARLSTNVALKSYVDANILGLPVAAPAAGQVGQSIRWNAGNTAWEYYTPTTSIAADSLNFTDFSDSLALDASTSITAPSGQAYALSVVNEGTGNSFFVGDEAADASPFVVDAGGNVGIGTASPSAKLDVAGNAFITGQLTVSGPLQTFQGYGVYSPSSGAAAFPSMAKVNATNTSNTDGNAAGFLMIPRRSGGVETNGYIAAISPAAGFTPDIVIGQQTGTTAYAERMRIDASGNLGIGDTTPDALLDVAGTLGLSGATSGTLTFAAPATVTSGTYVWPSAMPASNMVLQSDNTGAMSWVADSGGGLTNFTESVNSAAPNATVPVVLLLATNAAADVDIALTPKGTGALTAHLADNTTAGGNKRGQLATDWQRNRVNNTEVASGYASVIGGGQHNTASGGSSTIGGGLGNFATNAGATVGGGQANQANGLYSTIGGGILNNASGIRSSVVGGSHNNASGNWSLATGYTSTAAAYAQTSIGAFNMPIGTETFNSWVATDPLLVIGNGTAGGASRSNALMILKNGNTAFGNGTPSAKVDVKGTLGLSGATSGTLTFAAPATVTSGTYVWPSAMPASNMVLQSDNAGALSWITAATGTGDFLASGTVPMTGNLRLGNNWLSNDGGNEGLQVSTTGNVSVGSSAAPALLTLTSDNTTSDGLRFESSVGTANRMLMYNLGTNSFGMRKLNASSALIFENSAGSEEMRLSSSGNLGIGTSTPDAKLHIFNEGSSVGDLWVTAVGDNVGIHGRRARGTTASPLAVQAGDALTSFGSYARYATDYSSDPVGAFNILAAETHTSTAQGSYLTFETTNLGANTKTEKMRIEANGNVGIGTIAPAQPLEVNGNIRVGSQTTRTTASDRGQLAQGSTYVATVNANTTVDWDRGNIQELNTFACNGVKTITMSNIRDGAAYSLLLSGSAVHSGLCLFSAGGYTFKTAGGNVAPTASRDVLFTFAIINNIVVYSMMDNLQ